MTHQGNASPTRTTTHGTTVAAAPETVYAIVADVSRWPHTFEPTVHAEVVSHNGPDQVIRLWATANGEVKTWTSRRFLDPAGRRISFRQETSQHPVAAMGGEWRIEEEPDGGTRVLLDHNYRAVDDDPELESWIARAVDHNSTVELAALRAGAEQDDLTFSFEDSVEIHGDADRVYRFLHEAGEWPSRLPHVSRLELTEPTPGVQVMAMDTRTGDGSVHTTESVRICSPADRTIVYKQTRVPALMTAHTGRWTVAGSNGRTVATSQHTVVLRPAMISQILGPEAGVDEAKAYVHRALSGNSTATLNRAKAYAEQRHDN